ncbi:MAG: hypothetical protein MI757_05340 [Pirellulales bacterium]|nr:hypothetical protein [Pirellulales bacterium]
MNPVHHAESSAQKYGGVADDYLDLHQWFDESKLLLPDFRHRALRHHTEGIFMAERIFGSTITNSNGRQVPTRFLGEQHVKEDLGRIPTVQDWFELIIPQAWMMKPGVDPAQYETGRCTNTQREANWQLAPCKK